MLDVQVIHGGVSEPHDHVYDLLFFDAFMRLAANRRNIGELTIYSSNGCRAILRSLGLGDHVGI
jgi:hypothetical protein